MARLARLFDRRGWFVGVAAISMLLVALLVMPRTEARVRSARGPAPVHQRGMGPITALDMMSRSSGWGWGPTLVVRTVDGAQRLVDVTPAGVDLTHPVIAESALDATRAWVVAGPSSPPGRFTVYRTQDGGITWSAATIGNHQAGDLTFIDSRHGWMQSSRLVANHRISEITLSRTLDGGATWSVIYRTRLRIDIQPNVQIGGCDWSLVRFATPLRGLVGLECDKTATVAIERTDDGGKTWHRMALPPLHRPAGTVLWSEVQRPFLSGRAGTVLVTACVGGASSCYVYGILYRSVDGGKTWSAGGAVVRTSDGAVLADPNHVWLPYACLGTCGSRPQLLRTRDGGVHWTSLSLPAALEPNMHGSRQFQFVSPSVGFAVANQEFDPQTHFFRTTDGGQHFYAFQARIVHP